MGKTRDRKDRDYKTQPRTTRSQTLPARQAEIEKKELKARAEAELLRQRRENELKNRPKAKPGHRGDGSFHAAFIRMGQGDCALLTTPKGQVFMIDCGSNATDNELASLYDNRVRDVIFGEKFLKNNKAIDYLLLTHPDSDHYNKLATMLDNNVIIQYTYHSSPSIANYSQGFTSSWINRRIANPAFVLHVRHRYDESHARYEHTLNDRQVTSAPDPFSGAYLDDKSGICICQEEHFRATILASDVESDYKKDNSNPTNRGSLVTLVEVFGKKILFCGDATRSTEHYLLHVHKDRLKQLTLVTAGHHGSDNTSSHQEFVDTVDPECVIISAGKTIVGDHLPSAATIERYRQRMKTTKRTDVAEHEVFYWQPAALGSYNSKNKFITENIHITGSNETQFVTYEAT